MGHAPTPEESSRIAKPGTRIAIVAARWNQPIVGKLLEGAEARLEEAGVRGADRLVIRVPGAVELPIAAQAIARQFRPHAIVVLGAVVRGDTPHFDYVCQQVSYGCQRVALDESRPVIFGVLTVDTEAQAFERCGGVHGHKGREAADAALETLQALSVL